MDSLLPANECLLCLEKSGSELLCNTCVGQLPKFSSNQHTSYISRQAGSASVEVYSLFRYTWPITNMLHGFKYRQDYYAGRALSILLANSIATDVQPFLSTSGKSYWQLIPVPMHWRRIWQRRGNHTIYIAKTIRKKVKIPIDTDSIKLTRNPQTQASLDKKQREKNTKGLYFCKGSITGKRILLIDDIITTGNTMRSLAQILYQHGASEVRGLSIARGELH